MKARTPEATRPGIQDGASTLAMRTRRCFLAIDERERLIGWSQTTSGQLVIFLVAAAGVATRFPLWESALVVAAAMGAARMPNYRTPILCTATWIAAFLEMGLAENQIVHDIAIVIQQEHVAGLSPVVLAGTLLVGVMLCAWSALIVVSRHPKSYLGRHPLLTLLGLNAALCGLSCAVQGLPRVLLWSMTVVFTPYVWFLAYALVDQRASSRSAPALQMAVLRPFWSPTYLPYGKGAAFLRKTLSRTPGDLATTQLKAVKLLLWSNALFAIRTSLWWIFEDQMQVPKVGPAIDAMLRNEPYPIVIGWMCLILSTAKYTLNIAAWSGLFIGIARLAGYRLPRGCWRPLQSRTLMDYFNRSHYYFKELLVDFFFVPTFFTLFRSHPRLRMFVATFVAAGVGNALWHFFYDLRVIATTGFVGALTSFTSYAFYCAVLATGIGISQVRASLGIRPPATLGGRLYSFLFVWSFVVCLHVFASESRDHSLGDRVLFMASLLGGR